MKGDGGTIVGTEEQIFKRYEVKYLLDKEQYEQLRRRIEPYMMEDQYGETDICNCYYDTPDYRVIRTSMEKPVYKEKLRLRSYGVPAHENSKVYLELKKKFQGVVYKRREVMTLENAVDFLEGQEQPMEKSQILQEIDWFLKYYQGLKPAMFLSYRRIAMFEKTDEDCAENQKTHTGNLDMRVTFDWDICWRTEDIALEKGIYGNDLLEPGQRIMEVKTPGAMPRWFAEILDEMHIYPCSFSKYGRAYVQWQNDKKTGDKNTKDIA